MISFLKKHPGCVSVAVLALAVVLPYWHVAVMKTILITDDIFASDVMNDGFPYRFFFGHALKAGHLPLWYPPVYGGFPLLARAEAGLAYPLNLLAYGLFDPYIAFNIVFLATLFLAAYGGYLYVRSLGLTYPAALLAGIGFAYSGFMVSHMKHMSMVNAACWIPWGLLAIERLVGETREHRRGWKYAGGLAAVFGLQILSGHIQIAYYSGLLYLAYGLSRGVSPRDRTRSLRAFAALVVALAVGTLIGAVQLLPTYELVQLSQRSGGVTFDYATQFNYEFKNILMFLYPYANGDVGSGTYAGSGIFWEDYGYVGMATLLLGVVGMVRSWKSGQVRFFAITSVVAFLLVLGSVAPVYRVMFEIFPGWSFFRFPTRLLAIVDLALCVLAAYGVHALTASPGMKKEVQNPFPLLAVFVVALCCAELFFFQTRQNAFIERSSWEVPPATAGVLAGDSTTYRIYSLGATETHKAAYAEAEGWHGSLSPYLLQREVLQPSLNVLYGFSCADGYAQLTPNAVVDVWGDQNRAGFIMSTASFDGTTFTAGPVFEKLMDAFNIKYVLSIWNIQSTTLHYRETIRGVQLYRNDHVLPRAYLVQGYRVARNPADAVALFSREDFHPDREALLYERPEGFSGDTSSAGDVAFTSYGTDDIGLRVHAGHASLLVISDTDYPGWKAEIDGKDAPILQANFCQRALVVPAGEHHVRMRFVSKTAAVGFWISIGGLGLLSGLVIVGRRRE